MGRTGREETAVGESTYYVNNCILNSPSGFAKENIIYLKEIGKQNLFSPIRREAEGEASYLFFFVGDGHGILEYGDRSYVLSAGCCAFLDCGKPYVCTPLDGVLSAGYIRFSGFRMGAVYEEFIRHTEPCFYSHGLQIYREAWQRVYKSASEEEASPVARDMKIYADLVSLVTKLLRFQEDAPGQGKPKKDSMKYVKEYLENHYSEKISLDQLSEMFYINKFYLTRLFREQYGVSINRYLMGVRMNQAKELLRFSDLPVREIGCECGIGNCNYFFKVFKKWEGLSPGDFRKKELSGSRARAGCHYGEGV